MKRIIAITLLISIAFYVSGQNLPSSKDSKTIVFYNAGKFFDAVNDPGAYDDDFIPSGIRQWDEEKYKKRVTDVAKVLSAINENEFPSLIGLAEIENKKVAEDVISSSKLRRGKYGVVNFDKKDEKGLEIALLYKKDDFEVIDSKSISIDFGPDIKDVNRDFLYVKCRTKDDFICHIFVTQWPLRSPNAQESEIKRISAAISLRKEVDKILNFENNAHILILGDFNDEPTNKSVIQVLNATNKRKNINYRDLYNLMYDMHNTGNEGTITSGSGWMMVDQIIVSPAFFNKTAGYYLTFDDGKIYKGEEVLTTDPQTKVTTLNRTYVGSKYAGGVGSHLPVYIILKKEEK